MSALAHCMQTRLAFQRRPLPAQHIVHNRRAVLHVVNQNRGGVCAAILGPGLVDVAHAALDVGAVNAADDLNLSTGNMSPPAAMGRCW